MARKAHETLKIEASPTTGEGAWLKHLIALTQQQFPDTSENEIIDALKRANERLDRSQAQEHSDRLAGDGREATDSAQS